MFISYSGCTNSTVRQERTSFIAQLRNMKHKESETICSRLGNLTLGVQIKSQVIFPRLRAELANHFYHLSHRLRIAKGFPVPEI